MKRTLLHNHVVIQIQVPQRNGHNQHNEVTERYHNATERRSIISQLVNGYVSKVREELECT